MQVFIDSESAMHSALRIAFDSIIAEFSAQGHVDTGGALSQIKTEVKTTPDGIVGRIYGPKYLVYVNAGVKGNRVRYPIKVMVQFFRRRGLSERAATSAAWATRAVHQRSQMPTLASLRFSKTGKRTQFVNEGYKNAEQAAQLAFANVIEKGLTLNLGNAFSGPFEINILL